MYRATSSGDLNRWDTATYGHTAVLSEITKTQTHPRLGYRLFYIDYGILCWKFSNNVTESFNLCWLTVLYNAAFKVSFAIKGHAYALWPETFAYMKAAQAYCAAAISS